MADNDDAARALSTRGLRFMSREDGVEALWRALRTDLAQLAIMPIDWSRFGERIGAGAEGSLLAEQCASRGGTAARQATVDRANDDFLTRFTASAPKRRHRVLLDFVAAEVRRAVGLPGNHPIDERQPLQELGLDSLMAVELRNALSVGVKRTLPATFAFDYATAEAITRYLLEKLSVGTLPSVESISRGDASPEPAPRSAITAADHAVADMSDDEAARLLFQELAEIKNDVES